MAAGMLIVNCDNTLFTPHVWKFCENDRFIFTVISTFFLEHNSFRAILRGQGIAEEDLRKKMTDLFQKDNSQTRPSS